MNFYNNYVRSKVCYFCETWTLTKTQYERMERVQLVQRMVRGGMLRKLFRDEIKKAKKAMKDGVEDEEFKHTNEDLLNICHAEALQDFIEKQNVR